MAEPVILQVRSVILDVQTGTWCSTCALPSGYVMVVATEYPSGTPWEVLTLKGCGDCGAQESVR